LGDPVAALMTCAPAQAWLSVINGKVVVENHVLLGIDISALIKRHNKASIGMLQRSGLA
jgi:8-oxoguanine deaminase